MTDIPQDDPVAVLLRELAATKHELVLSRQRLRRAVASRDRWKERALAPERVRGRRAYMRVYMQEYRRAA